MIAIAHLRRVDHLRNDHGLEQAPSSSSRTRREGNIAVEVGEIRLLRREEAFAHKVEHGCNDARVGHIAGANLAVDHHATRRGKVGHSFSLRQRTAERKLRPELRARFYRSGGSSGALMIRGVPMLSIPPTGSELGLPRPPPAPVVAGPPAGGFVRTVD